MSATIQRKRPTPDLMNKPAHFAREAPPSIPTQAEPFCENFVVPVWLPPSLDPGGTERAPKSNTSPLFGARGAKKHIHPHFSELGAQKIKYIRTFGAATQRKSRTSAHFGAKWANRQIHSHIFGRDTQTARDICAFFKNRRMSECIPALFSSAITVGILTVLMILNVFPP